MKNFTYFRFMLKIKVRRVLSWFHSHAHIGRIGYCPCCYRLRTDILRRRQLTQYNDDASNWVTCCADCKIENDAYWEERWAEYYGQIL